MEYSTLEEYINEIENLLIDFDEMSFCPTTTCPFPEEYAINWRKDIATVFASLVYFIRKEVQLNE